jgi:hypothetical protein
MPSTNGDARGLSLPAVSLIAPGWLYKDIEQRPAPDLVKAKQLMTAAGTNG